MGRQFDFNRLINKYSSDCQLLQEANGEDGGWIAGNWVPGAAPVPIAIRGAIVPLSDRKIYLSGGSYMEQDREFITSTAIPMDRTCHILHQGSSYKVESNTDYSDYAGFYAYNLKKVDAFDRTGKD